MRNLFIIVILGIFSISCTKDHLTADGNIITETRKPGQFIGIHSSGANAIHVSYGTTFNVEVKGSANLLPRYETKVRNGILYLGYEWANIHKDDIEVFVTMPAISSASMNGSGNLDISGSFPQEELFRLTISGSSNTIVRDEIKVNSLHVDISGSGDANLEKVRAAKADIRISGSGDVRATVDASLKARISGSGKVYYTGNATAIDSDISGSGKVIKY